MLGNVCFKTPKLPKLLWHLSPLPHLSIEGSPYEHTNWLRPEMWSAVAWFLLETKEIFLGGVMWWGFIHEEAKKKQRTEEAKNVTLWIQEFWLW